MRRQVRVNKSGLSCMTYCQCIGIANVFFIAFLFLSRKFPGENFLTSLYNLLNNDKLSNVTTCNKIKI